MNYDEEIAYKYLQTKNFTKIEFEPKGNIPPDFLLDEEIAVEVRRLNQHVIINNNSKPLEELRYKIVPKIKEIISDLTTPEYTSTLIVSVGFKRPLKVKNDVFKRIKLVIQENIETTRKDLKISITENLDLRFFRSDLRLSKSIIFGTESDSDSGGYVVSNIYNNLKLVVNEKEKKIEKFYTEYKKWWLIVVDHIAYGLDSFDFEQLSEFQMIQSKFEKIFIVSPTLLEESRELKFKNASA